MGPQQSQVKRRFSTDAYVAVNEQGTSFIEDATDSHLNPNYRKQSFDSSTVKRIANHGIAAIWSARSFKSDNIPNPRTGFFYVTDEISEIIYIGFGQLNDGSLTNEIWALNRKTLQWKQFDVQGDSVSPRSGSRAVLYNGNLLIFGGKDEFNYFNELYSFNIATCQMKKLETKGSLPSPRCGAIMGIYQQKVIVWSGYDGGSPNSLYILDLNKMEWRKKEQSISGRSAAAFVQDENFIYICGSSKSGGLVTIDMDKEKIAFTETEGSEPIGTVTNAGLTKINDYLIFSGGQSSSDWSLVYALDISNKTWFIVHIVPDRKTVFENDGNITETGIFMIPRTYSMAVSFDKNTRILYSFMGSPMKDSSKVYTLDLGNAIAVMHLRDDLLTEFHKNEVGDTIDD